MTGPIGTVEPAALRMLAQRTAELFADWDARDLAAATEVLVRLSATFDRASVLHDRAPA